MIDIPISTIKDIEALSESADIECKLANGKDGKGALPQDFWPTYSAFANTRGGIVLLGVGEKNHVFSLKGIKNTDKVQKELFDNANNLNKVSVNLLNNDTVETVEIDGKTIIKITIPQATRHQQPVFLKGNPLGGNTYKRLHEADVKCSDESVKRMLAEQVENERDRRIMRGFDFNDIDKDTLAAFRQALRSAHPTHPFLDRNDVDFFKAIGGWRRNRETGEEGMTLAGLLMFGTWAAIQEGAPNYFVDYQERPEPKVEARWIDRIVPDGTWSGNLYDFYRRVYRKMITDLRVPFVLKDGQRKDETPVHEAIREALVNTIAHADYTGSVSIFIAKRPDMFGFRNPGHMRIPIEQAIRGGESDCRNKTIHQMFLLVGLGERAGSGIPKIYRNWNEHHWRTPKLYEKDEPDQTLMELRMIDLIPMDIVENLRSKFGSGFDNLPNLERLILATAASEVSVTIPRIQEISTEHPHDVSTAFKGLISSGHIDQIGKGKTAIYHIKGERPLSVDDVFSSPADISDPSNDNNFELAGSSVGTDKNSVGTDKNSVGMDNSSVGKDSNSVGMLHEHLDMPIIHKLDELDSVFKETLLNIASPVRLNKRTSKDEMIQVIKSLCDGHYITLQVLAALLERSDSYLRIHVLKELVNSSQMRLAFPASPNDPRQAYGWNELGEKES